MATGTLVLIISTIITLTFAQCTVENVEPNLNRSVYEFSTELASKIANKTDNHFVISVLSAWTLIATLSLGSTNETLEEIINVLKLHPNKCFNKKVFEIIRTITSSDDGAILERSSTLFADNRLPLYEEYLNAVNETEVSEIQSIAFVRSEVIADVINNHVKEATRENIDNIVSPADLEGVYLILIDAIYFKGTWRTRFAPKDTKESAFYDETGNQIGDVNLMFSRIEANVCSISSIEAKVLELPYGNNNKLSMLIFLPDYDVSLLTVMDNLKKISIRSIFSSFRVQIVNVQLPRFEMTSDTESLKESLIEMGLRTMFNSSSATFTDISDYSLYVSKFIQKANVEVTEEGSGVGTASMKRSIIIEFTVDKPFLFMIVDKETEVVLFTGAYSKPSLY